MILSRSATHPNEIALEDGTRRRSWAELEDRLHRIAHWLRDDLEVPAGAHVAVLMDNRVEAVEVVIGAMLAGLWVTPVNRHLRAEEIAHVLTDSGARVVVTDAAHEATARDAGAPQIAVAGDALERALASASDAPLDFAGPAGGSMMYTGGTSGRPKGVRRARPAALGAALDAQRRAGSMIGLDGSRPRPGDRARSTTPRRCSGSPSHGPARSGAPLVIVMPRWDPEAEALRPPTRVAADPSTRTWCRPCSCGCCGWTRNAGARRVPTGRRCISVLHGAAPVAAGGEDSG